MDHHNSEDEYGEDDVLEIGCEFRSFVYDTARQIAQSSSLPSQSQPSRLRDAFQATIQSVSLLGYGKDLLTALDEERPKLMANIKNVFVRYLVRSAPRHCVVSSVADCSILGPRSRRTDYCVV